ncbi:hypothetical protein B0H11DRAFT_1928990 [Mycena galericulata]|nr:hypothetical protein B0H11DRAFT_1928990 [Mycena galericulata]
MYSARIDDCKSAMTVAWYQGPNAEQSSQLTPTLWSVGLPTVPSTGTAVKLAAIFSAFWGRDGYGTAKRRPSTGTGRQWQLCPPSSIINPQLPAGQGITPSGKKLMSRKQAVYGRQRPPAPVPSMVFPKGSTGRDGMPLMAPVTPVKTGTVGSPNIGVASTGSMHAAVFHDDLIPLEQFVDIHRNSPILPRYFRAYWAAEFFVGKSTKPVAATNIEATAVHADSCIQEVRLEDASLILELSIKPLKRCKLA